MVKRHHRSLPEQLSSAKIVRTQSKDYYSALVALLAEHPTAESYARLYQLLLRLCEEDTPQMHFSNLFSRLSYVCRQHKVSPALMRDMQSLRRKCFHIDEHENSVTAYRSDLRTFAEFIRCVLASEWPKSLNRIFAKQSLQPFTPKKILAFESLRMVVAHWDDRYIYGYTEYSPDETVCVDCVNGDYDGDLLYVVDLLSEGLTLNMIHVKVDDRGCYVPQLIIVMPDYLVDISTLASAFKACGHDVRNVLLSRLERRRDTPYTLLGHLAGLFLDQIVRGAREHRPVSYAECVKLAFQSDPLSYALTPLDSQFNFHEEARRQFNNVRQVVSAEFPRYGFNLDKGLTEASFVCEKLGLVGRMDYLQSDYTRLVEQKSGKWDEFRHAHKEAHYIQMMLYRAVIEYGLNIPAADVEAFLLYSKYADGLLPEHTLKSLLREALALRNRVASMDLQCAQTGVRGFLENVDADALATDANTTLWKDWERPRVAAVLDKFRTDGANASPKFRLAQAYFYCFYDFLCREQMQARVVAPGNAGRAFSDLWNLPAAARHELGSLYWNLTISRLMSDARGINAVEFAVPQDDDGFRSNFRRGDVVLIYSYSTDEPDARRQFLLRGRLKEQSASRLLIELNSPQSNSAAFGDKNARYAVEHDYVEASAGRLYASLYAFLEGDACRRDLLLCQREAKVAEKRPVLKGDYHQMNGLVCRERQAEELFFVIGPPGSGKTSQAIRSMVEEELRQTSQGKILLMAYTNRAVDELCGMLEGLIKEHPDLLDDYVRFGSPLSAAENYRSRLLNQRCDRLQDTSSVLSLLSRTRVFVGTAVMLTSLPLLFEHMTFDVAFVDEASQLLEPHLLPFFFFRRKSAAKSHLEDTKSDIDNPKSDLSIRKFVLVGDQKQLPAVVCQSAAQSVVQSKALQAIGLTDCRHSLFERLLANAQRSGNSSLYYLLQHQGRMHPGLYGFVNAHFYNNRLLSVGLPHQKRPVEALYPMSAATGSNTLAALLCHHRFIFINQPPLASGEAPKTNLAEARQAVRCLINLRELYALSGRRLTPNDVGIIVPYRNQIALVARLMAENGLDGFDETVADTVERYQGSQRDIIIFLFTVHQPFGLHFLSASTYLESADSETPYPVDRKLNVTLTRAREQIILIGHAPLLRRNAIYRQLLAEVRKNGGYLDASAISFGE